MIERGTNIADTINLEYVCLKNIYWRPLGLGPPASNLYGLVWREHLIRGVRSGCLKETQLKLNTGSGSFKVPLISLRRTAAGEDSLHDVRLD